MTINFDAEYTESIFIVLGQIDKLSHGIQSATACFAGEPLEEAENKLRARQIEIMMKELNKQVSELNHIHSMWLGNRALRYRMELEKTT